MSDLPTEATIIRKHPIELLAAPSRITHLNTRKGPINPEHLLQVGWKCVIVKCAPERNVTLQGVMGYQKLSFPKIFWLAEKGFLARGQLTNKQAIPSMDNVQLRCPRHAACGQKNKLLSCLVILTLHPTQ